MTIPNHSSRPYVSSLPAATAAEGRLLLTLNQAAQALAISKRTLERLIAGRAFPMPLKIGRSSRVAYDDITNYLEQLRHQRGDKLGTS